MVFFFNVEFGRLELTLKAGSFCDPSCIVLSLYFVTTFCLSAALAKRKTTTKIIKRIDIGVPYPALKDSKS